MTKIFEYLLILGGFAAVIVPISVAFTLQYFGKWANEPNVEQPADGLVSWACAHDFATKWTYIDEEPALEEMVTACHEAIAEGGSK